jgi:Flp pilus assembly protein TadB
MTNAYEFLRDLTLSNRATDNMIRLIWAITDVSVVLVGIGCTVLLILPQYRMAGSFGMATAVIAGMGGAIWRWKKWRQRRAKRHGKV